MAVLFDKVFANVLTLTLTVKEKPEANPYKQIPENMQEKRFKAEEGKSC